MSTDHQVNRQQLQSQIATLRSTVTALERRLEEMERMDRTPSMRQPALVSARITSVKEVQLAIAAG